MPAICFFLQWMFLRALPSRLGKNFFDKAVLHQFIDHAIVDDFGSERFGVDAFDGFELQDRSHISAIDPGCFFSELGDEGVSFFEKIGITPFEIFCQHLECGLFVVIHRADGFDGRQLASVQKRLAFPACRRAGAW